MKSERYVSEHRVNPILSAQDVRSILLSWVMTAKKPVGVDASLYPRTGQRSEHSNPDSTDQQQNIEAAQTSKALQV